MFALADPDFFTTNGLGFWIIVWVYLLSILGQVIIKNHLKKKPKQVKPKPSAVAGVIILTIATQFSLISTVGLSLLDSQGDICLAIAITKEQIDKNMVWDCVADENNKKWNLVDIGVVMTVITLFVDIFERRSRK